MSQETEEVQRDPLHIGNLLNITSEAYGSTVGRVVYRSLELVNIMPQESSDRAISFRMAADGSTFAPDLGVTAIEIVEEQDSNYYVDVLGAQVGETLEFFTLEGEPAAESGTVAAIIKEGTDDDVVKDNIKLTDGRTLRFYGVGPKAPIAVIRVVSGALDVPAVLEEGLPKGQGQDKVQDQGQDQGPGQDKGPGQRQADLLALFRSVLPSAKMEVVPTAERSYPDSMQREDLFQDLLAEITEKQRTNPRRIRFIEREVDLAISLKNKSISRDAAGRIIGVAPYMITTIKEALDSVSYKPAAIPIVEAARVLNLDENPPLSYKASDVAPRTLDSVEQESEARASSAEAFYPYIYDLLSRGQSVLSGPGSGSGWATDQDVLRTAAPEVHVEGLSTGLPVDPYSTTKEVPPVTLAFLIENVAERSIRVITADTTINRKTGATSVIAQSDPSKVIGYLMLAPLVAMALRPPLRPRHLPTALLYSEILQRDSHPTVTRVIQDPSFNSWTCFLGPGPDEPIGEWLESVIAATVSQADSLAPRSPRLLSLLDTLGLVDSDMSPAVATIVWAWVRQSQTAWETLLKTRRTDIQASIDTEEARTFQTVTGLDTTVWAALRSAESLKELIEDIGRRNPTIIGSETVLTAALLTEAQGDATPLVWTEIAKLDARELPGLDPVTAAAALAASRAYALRRKALRDKELLLLRASPEINTCPHVKRLEAIRNVGDPRLLRGFVEEFQGPKSGEWMTCILCKGNCVCYHELMQLEALASASVSGSRSDAIQKQILIKFGGERYEGKIVCKNCGQALQDIDFDDHVEFDDAGRAIVTASVLTDEQLEEPTETAWKKATAALIGATESVTFAIPSQRILGEILETIAITGRLQIEPSVIQQIVRYADLYVSVRAPPAAVWEAQRQKMLKSAASKKIPEPYDVVVDRLRVTALIALTAIAIQSSDPPIVIKNPMNECPFSRGGYPFDPTAKPDDPGALLYVACATAFIQRAARPWTSMAWAQDKLESRKTKALAGATSALQVILGSGEGAATLSFSPEIRQALDRARTDVVAIRERALVSLTDQLPLSFRPDPFPPTISRPVLERDPVPIIIDALETNKPILAMVPAIADSLRMQAIAIVGEMHANASVSATVSFADANAGALLGAPEQQRLLTAGVLLRGANPTAVNAGTHLWPVFNEPVPTPVEQSVDESVFFKLFLKYCYAGPRVGEPHEFSVGNMCRQCGLALGKPVDLIDFAKEGAAILAAQQGDLRIEITQGRFNNLSETVRAHKVMRPLAVKIEDQNEWLQVITATPGLEVMASRLAEVLGAQGSAAYSGDRIARISAWTPVAALMDELRAEVTSKVNIPKFKAMDIFDAMLEDPYIEGPRAIQEYWCAKAEAAGKNFLIIAGRWDKNLAQKHKDMMDKLVADNSTWFSGSVTDGMKLVLQQVASTLGPTVKAWIRLMRPSVIPLEEARLILQTLVLQVWRDALTPSSSLYRDIPADRETTAAGLVVWTRSLMQHVKMQFVKFSKETIKRILQDRAALERDTIVEEFASIKDDDQKAAELIKKQFRIGRWAGGKNLQKYDPDTFEFENEQRKRMGIMDPPIDPILALAPGVEGVAEDFGLGPVETEQEEGYAVEQGAEGDDY